MVERRRQPVAMPSNDAGQRITPARRLARHWRSLRRLLSRLCPFLTRASPSLFDSLLEGVVVLDERRTILFANPAFLRLVAVPLSELLGQPLDALPWQGWDAGRRGPLPWERAFETRQAQPDAQLVLEGGGTGQRRCVVNVSPLFERGPALVSGAVVTFHDYTAHFERAATLRRTLVQLRAQRREIGRQNRELRALAMRDPLTGCLNRRAFLSIFDAELQASRKRGSSLACVLCDIDAFKAINDNHGHSMGDRVIEQCARLLEETVCENDYLCRYGGEEFCVLLPGLDVSEARQVAERMRVSIAGALGVRAGLPGMTPITASLGVTDVCLGASSLTGLIDQADAALYESKARGRNRVTVFGESDGVQRLPVRAVDARYSQNRNTP